MGWLGDLWKHIVGAPTDDLVFVPSLTLPNDGWINAPIAPDETYIELRVESLRLKRARRFASAFHGVVYSFVTLARQANANASLAALSKPERLATLDANSLDKVITVSKQMMGAVPWRGGDLKLELGLFSVKSGNLLSPVLDLVAQVSTTAGISFIGKMEPFVPLITKGMDLIAGQTEDTQMEVALDTTLQLNRAGLFAIIDAKKGSIDAERVTIDPADMKLLLDGRPLKEGYCVFSIRAIAQKADFGEIPELRDRYAAIQTAIRENDIKRARDALAAFRLTALTSPDLISADARRLVQKVTQLVNDAFPTGPTGDNATARMRELADAPLASIALY